MIRGYSAYDVLCRARELAMRHPTASRPAPVGRRYVYEDRRIRIQVCDQLCVDDCEIYARNRWGAMEPVLIWSTYNQPDISQEPQVYVPGHWVDYVDTLAGCQTREFLQCRAERWFPRPQSDTGVCAAAVPRLEATMRVIEIITDGCCLEDGVGGWAYVARCGSAEQVAIGAESGADSARMESSRFLKPPQR